jgi:uncharacterized membrane protein
MALEEVDSAMVTSPARPAMTGHPPPSTFRMGTRVMAWVLASAWFCPAILVALIACEWFTLSIQASRKYFWFDELLTFHITSLHPFSRVLEALHAGLAGMTPGYYAMVQLARMAPGDPHLILRLPSLLGYTLTLLGAYWFTSKRMPAITGLAAVLLLTLSPFRAYAVEARSYALLVGFLAIAAVLWQRVGDRRFLTPLFAIVLTLAVSCHHLAIVAIAIFAGTPGTPLKVATLA